MTVLSAVCPLQSPLLVTGQLVDYLACLRLLIAVVSDDFL